MKVIKQIDSIKKIRKPIAPPTKTFGGTPKENNKKDRQLTDIAKLLNTSVNNIKLIETGALSKIEESLNHLRGITD